MWSRKEFKQKARAILRTTYWKALLICAVVRIASINISQSQWKKIMSFILDKLTDFELIPKLLIFFSILFAVFLLTLVFKILIRYPFLVGESRYFIRCSLNACSCKQIVYAYRKTAFVNVVKAMLWRDLFTYLWGLLIIPLFIKAYSYSMVPFILADNPNIGYRRALELSICMTDGYKGKMFVLNLSMIGWILPYFMLFILFVQFRLFDFAFFITLLMGFVSPYFNQVNAETYLFLRKKAIKNKYTSAKELNLNS